MSCKTNSRSVSDREVENPRRNINQDIDIEILVSLNPQNLLDTDKRAENDDLHYVSALPPVEFPGNGQGSREKGIRFCRLRIHGQ